MATFKGVKLTVEDITFVENLLQEDRRGRINFDDPHYKNLIDLELKVRVSLEAELERQKEAS